MMVHLLVTLAALAFPFVAMPLLWRRMKRVRTEAYRRTRPAAPRPDWEETLDVGDRGERLVRRDAHNPELTALGDRAHHARWPIDNA